jgi:putative ATP-dependent endonuclease of OLD family
MIYIKELYVKNFRSIEEERIEFNKGLNILVGPNNAGKTNIIEAIDLLLGDVYLPNFEPSTDHFFNGEEDREIIIEALLEGDGLKEINEEFDSQIYIRFKFSKQNGGLFEIKKNGQWQTKWSKNKQSPFGYYSDFDKKLFFLRVKSLRNIMEIAPIRWKSPLKYFKEIIIKKAPKEKLDDVISSIDEAKNKLMNINEVRKIISDLEKISKDQTDIKKINLSPSSTKYSDFLNEMKILIDDGYISEVFKKGLGTQNLIIISLFRVMAKYIRDEEKKFIIYGIDEPEIGLHPHSQRQLIFSLKNLSEYSQVIITTHSDRLIDITQIDNIIRVGKEDSKTKHYKINLSPDERKILEIHGGNLQEIFFAKRVLIVEGYTEEGFFPEISKKFSEVRENDNEKVNYSFDYNSVSVINSEGDKIWFFIKLVKNLNIPFIALIDDDKLDNIELFLRKMKENNLITAEEESQLKRLDIGNLKDSLKKYNVYICKPFEKMISESAGEDTLRKIIKAIKFVKEHWGYEVNHIDLGIENGDLREKAFELLKNNKRWRIGKAIAQELEPSEIPNAYIEIIKKVSKL